jgi:anaerobic magnesium-protoporphyrin IX monomethyl ester cyclase
MPNKENKEQNSQTTPTKNQKRPKFNFESEDRDQIVLSVIQHEEEMRHANSHLGKLDNPDVAKKYTPWRQRYDSDIKYQYWSSLNKPRADSKISFVVCPAWGVVFPPYNAARLSALLRQNGYEVDVYDTNIKAYHHLKETLNYDPWDAIYWDHWQIPNYNTHIRDALKPLLDETIQQIIADGSQFVGFSVYATNLLPTSYMMKELKRLAPEICIIIGGPESFQDWLDDKRPDPYNNHLAHLADIMTSYDVRIIGEGEEMLLGFLDNHLEYPNAEGPHTFGGVKSRLDLNQLPFPDYSDYDLNEYTTQGGVSIETSRGCIALCSFCSETHFWKFRSRDSHNVIDEMQHQIDTYGTNRFWFVDSLVNGNLKSFRDLVDQIIERKMDIRWNSYARCDGRMDLDFFHKIKASGCSLLSFGVESGSEKVLDEMKKKIKVWEIENNLRDARIANIENHVNWVIGFPTETTADWCHSLHVLYNTRNWVTVISPGMTCGDAPLSDMNKNWKDYNIAWNEKPWDNKFMSNWYTIGYENTVLHRSIRLKYANQWLSMCVNEAEGSVINAQSRPGFNKFVDFKWNNPGKYVDYIPQQDKQDFNKFNHADTRGQFAASLANENLPHMWIMYQAFGGHSFKMIWDPKMDMEEFGMNLATMLSGEAEWNVNDNGDYEFKCWYEFEHIAQNEDATVKDHEIVREDMSFKKQLFEASGNLSEFDGIIKHNE